MTRAPWVLPPNIATIVAADNGATASVSSNGNNGNGRVLAAAVQARTRLIENGDAARRLSAEEVTALAEAIGTIDGLIEVVHANVSRSGGR